MTRSGRTIPIVAIVASLAAAAAFGQETDLAKRPPGAWVVTEDGAARGDPPRVERRNGNLRILTGAAGIFHVPSVRGEGTYRIEAELVQFDPAGRNEAYGVFVGGRDLGRSDIVYTYFLIRRDGSALVKRREGSRTVVIRDWVRHGAVHRWDDRPEGADRVANVLTVNVHGDTVTFSVNGVAIHTIEGGVVEADGVVGMRVNHGLDVEVVRYLVSPM